MKLWFAVLVLAVPASAQKLHELCAACHGEPASDFQSHAHFAKGLSCDACHGSSAAHREATGHKPPDQVAGPRDQPRVCGTCHPAQKKGYESSKHAEAVMAGGAKKAAACTTCHGTHASRKPVAMIAQCNRCHASLPASCQGAPVAEVSKVRCANCHDRHALQARK